MQSVFQGEFVAETFDKSKFKPKKVVSTIEEITPKIQAIFDDINNITNTYNDLVSNSVNSSEWLDTAKQITQTSNDVNYALKNMATNIITHITEVYEQAKSVNKQLSFEITEQKESMANSLALLGALQTGTLVAPTKSNYEAPASETQAPTEGEGEIPPEETTDTSEKAPEEVNPEEKNTETNESDQAEAKTTEEPTTNTGNKNVTNIPSDVKQSGITRNYTNYDYFYNKWSNSTGQRALADQWDAQGRASDRGIATINDRYLVAVSTKFGSVGDNIDVVLDDGTVIPCTIADAKGSDATSEWGHVLGGGGVDVVEWESVGSADVINIDGWDGKKVTSIINNNC